MEELSEDKKTPEKTDAGAELVAECAKLAEEFGFEKSNPNNFEVGVASYLGYVSSGDINSRTFKLPPVAKGISVWTGRLGDKELALYANPYSAQCGLLEVLGRSWLEQHTKHSPIFSTRTIGNASMKGKTFDASNTDYVRRVLTERKAAASVDLCEEVLSALSDAGFEPELGEDLKIKRWNYSGNASEEDSDIHRTIYLSETGGATPKKYLHVRSGSMSSKIMLPWNARKSAALKSTMEKLDAIDARYANALGIFQNIYGEDERYINTWTYSRRIAVNQNHNSGEYMLVHPVYEAETRKLVVNINTPYRKDGTITGGAGGEIALEREMELLRSAQDKLARLRKELRKLRLLDEEPSETEE